MTIVHGLHSIWQPEPIEYIWLGTVGSSSSAAAFFPAISSSLCVPLAGM